MNAFVVLAMVVGLGLWVGWFLRARKARLAAHDAATKKTEKAERAAAQAVQNSIKGRR